MRASRRSADGLEVRREVTQDLRLPGDQVALDILRTVHDRPEGVGDHVEVRLGVDAAWDGQAPFEFTRLAVPRRVYTQAHLDVAADALRGAMDRAEGVKGYL